MPDSTSQRPRSSGVRSRSNERRQRSPTVAARSRHGRPARNRNRSSSGGNPSITFATTPVLQVSRIASPLNRTRAPGGTRHSVVAIAWLRVRSGGAAHHPALRDDVVHGQHRDDREAGGSAEHG